MTTPVITAAARSRDAPPAPKLTAAQHRRIAFARAFCRLGQTVAALREVKPSCRHWQPDSIAHEAGRLMRDPTVQAEIRRINEDARLDAIASTQEIAKTLVEIMRGQLTETRIIRDATGGQAAVEVPPSTSSRINAMKVLAAMLPDVTPPKPETNSTHDDATSTLIDRLAQIQKKKGKTK